MNSLPELNFSVLAGKGVEPGPFHCLLPPDFALLTLLTLHHSGTRFYTLISVRS